MQRTLLFLPHEIAGIPLLGFGWLLLLLAVFVLVRLFLANRAGNSIPEILGSEGLLWAGVALAVVFILPMIELKNVDGDPVGTAIRGYGVFLVMGVAVAIALAAYRAKRYGIDPEIIFSMVPWVFIAGIAGARLFYVIQYFERFRGPTMAETLRSIFLFNEGGLVVYGSFIGGFLVGLVYVYKRKLPVFRLGDVIIPCLFIGLFFGRMGCLMNGCCYGGRCEEGLSAVRFPVGSPVYREQIDNGELFGIRFDDETRIIESVESDSPAARRGIRDGSYLRSIRPDTSPLGKASRDVPAEEVPVGWMVDVDGRKHYFAPEDLPDRALPVQAAQILSSVSGLLLCIALCVLSYFVKRSGVVMMTGIAAYPMIRFLLEWVRVDEAGQFDTTLTIGQWVSVLILVGAAIGFVLVFRRSPDEDDQDATHLLDDKEDGASDAENSAPSKVSA